MKKIIIAILLTTFSLGTFAQQTPPRDTTKRSQDTTQRTSTKSKTQKTKSTGKKTTKTGTSKGKTGDTTRRVNPPM